MITRFGRRMSPIVSGSKRVGMEGLREGDRARPAGFGSPDGGARRLGSEGGANAPWTGKACPASAPGGEAGDVTDGVDLVAAAQVGGSPPACSRTTYSAYQSGQS